MDINIKSLFKTKDQTQVTETPSPQTTVQTLNVQELNPDARKHQETYQQWGSRMCGKVAASIVALPAYLNAVYFDIKKSQSQNQALQTQLRMKIENEISHNQLEQDNIQNDIDYCDQKTKQSENEIDVLTKEEQRIKEGQEKVNKDEKMKLVIGLCILIPLSIYLFIFYSSAFYSAFFKDFNQVTGLASAIFDANSIPNAFKDGMMEAMFILFAPIIFMGLGFILHFLGKEELKVKRFFKMGAIVLVTLTFDIIIAYQIGKHIYDNWVLSQLQEFPPFSISEAITDPNFWAVIFCGFIAYIIWGLLFNMVMDAYSKLDLSKVRLKQIAQDIINCKQVITDNKEKKHSLISDLNKKKHEGKLLLNRLNNSVIYDIDEIKQEVVNFWTGWLQNMAAQGCSHTQQKNAENTYNTTIKTLFPS